MHSAELSDIQSWQLWGDLAVQNAPRSSGVYAFRMAAHQVVGRFKGQSDIVYIGATVAVKGSLRKRLAQHLVARVDGMGLGARLKCALQEIGRMEIGWIMCPDNHAARWLESELLSKYSADHLELPPLNRSESGIRIRGVMRLIALLPDQERQAALAKILQTKEPQD
jgi:hypothetical protein